MNDREIYRGRFDHVRDRKLNSVRVFISSTFSDTIDERHGLIEHVYPKLREYCLKKYKIQFQYSDMRWGIQSLASNDHSTVDLCLQELDTCCQLSIATNCIILLSHRYGSRPPPATIPRDLYLKLEHALLSKPDERIFLSEMYQLDENNLNMKYCLRPIDDHKRWSTDEKRLQSILRQAADICYKNKTITNDERKEFYISVTAKEIDRALKNNKSSSRRMICFIRDILDINELDSKFRETDSTSDTLELLQQIQSLLRHSLDPVDIFTYQVRWNDKKQHDDYLARFFNDFFEALKSQIDFHIQNDHLKQMKLDVLHEEILEHAIQCTTLTQRYFPRPDILEQVKQYVKSMNIEQSCVLLGESGTGKSSIMARLVAEIPTWYSQSDFITIIVRFLGTTTLSADIVSSIYSIIKQICVIYQLNLPAKYNHLTSKINLTELKQLFEETLMRIPKNEQLILLFDSIDQLQIDNILSLSWLPFVHLPNVKCIFSTIPDIVFQKEKISIISQLKAIYGSTMFQISIKPFDKDIANQVLLSWLAQDQRHLTSLQFSWLQYKLDSSNSLTPLFLSLIYDQTLKWHSYDTELDRNFLQISIISDAIQYLYEQLGKKHGHVLFKHAIYYIQLSGGINESELEDLLSLDDQVLQSVFVHYLPPLNIFRLPSTLWIRIRNDMRKYLVERLIDNIPCITFYHQSFREYQPISTKLVIESEQEKAEIERIRLDYFANRLIKPYDMNYSAKLIKKYAISKSTLIDVQRCLSSQKSFKFKNRQFNIRRIHQLYLNINRYDFAHLSTIYNYEFISAYLLCGEYKMSNLLDQMSMGSVEINGELRYILKLFETSSFILDRYPNNFAFELIYHLSPIMNVLHDQTYDLLQQCLINCSLQMISNRYRQKCLAYYTITDNDHIVCMFIDWTRLYMMTDHHRLIILNHTYFGFVQVKNLALFNEKSTHRYSSFLCEYPYVCFVSSDTSSIAMIDCGKGQISMQVDCLHILGFINKTLFLIVRRVSISKSSLQLWDLATNSLRSKADFDDDSIEECKLTKITKSQYFIKVVLNKNERMAYYFMIGKDNLIALHRNVATDMAEMGNLILADTNTELFYSSDRSYVTLIRFNEHLQQTKETISFPSRQKKVVPLVRSNALAWITVKSMIIFHSTCTNSKPFCIGSTTETEYDDVHDNYSSFSFEDQTNFIGCLSIKQNLIDIIQWQCVADQRQHIYRYLVRLPFISLDIDSKMSLQFVFNVDWDDGITVFCSNDNRVYKYNATMMNGLSSLALRSEEEIMQLPSTHGSKHLIFRQVDQSVRVATLSDDNELNWQLDLRDQIIIDYVVTSVSLFMLTVNKDHSLAVYSLVSNALVWSTREFDNAEFSIHSLCTSFIIICTQKKQLYEIKPCLNSSLFETKLITNLSSIGFDCSSSSLNITSIENRLFIMSNNQSTIVEYNANNQRFTQPEPIQLITSRIIQIYAVVDSIILQSATNQLLCWQKKQNQLIMLEQAEKLTFKHDRLVFVCMTDKQIIVYDLKKNLRGTIRLNSECDELCLSETYNEQQFLFVICRDRLLYMFNIENGKQLEKLFIHSNLCPCIATINNRLLLKIDNNLCILKIEQKQNTELSRKRTSNFVHSLFKTPMWMNYHQDGITWSSTPTDSTN